jgi:hypothetical protein
MLRTAGRALALCALVATTGCRERAATPRPEPAVPRDDPGPVDPVSVRAGELLADLRSADPHTRTIAVDQIRGLSGRHALTEEEGLALLRGLPTVPPPPLGGVDLQVAVLAALSEDPRLPYLRAIEDVAADLRPAARARALALVGMIDDPTAARTFLRLLDHHPDPSPSLAFAHLQQHPQQLDVLFPALLALTTHPALFEDVATTALAWCDRGFATPSSFAPHADTLLGVYRDQREALIPLQKPSGVAWMWRDTYAEPRRVASMLLDLFGCLPFDLVSTDLTEALTYRDPHLLYVATRSLMSHDVVPPAAIFERMAAADETRVWLYQLLVDADRRDLFPARHFTQEAFARSQLADWLAARDHLGRIPESFTLLAIVPVDAGPPDGILDFYVFSFPSDHGTLAGVAGPYLRSAEPTIDDHAGTFSALELAAAKTPADHVGDAAAILRAWRRP